MEAASQTARRVAAQRLSFDRLTSPTGRPEDDDRLAADVAGGLPARPNSPMRPYLEARTRFFDGVVVAAIDRGIRQIVIGAAGYDGRALRFARDGVRWWELDHPMTQADKLERLARLRIDTAGISFVSADFAVDDVAVRLTSDGGLDPTQPTLFTLEGVLVYLDIDVITRLLAQLRRVAGPESLLAVSVSTKSRNPFRALLRSQFRRRVAAMGEPARSHVDSTSITDLLRATGWRQLPSEQRRLAAGLIVADVA